MNRTVQHITRKLVDLLPENEQYYRLNELRQWQFPDFIVKRIKIELERNLAESLILPESDWANIESEAVQRAWQQFVDAIRAEARLPASYAKAVIETAVADVLEMLVQPRKNIPEVIYGADEKLQHENLQTRLDAIVVYRHFAAIILRYMQKRERDALDKVKCKEIISLADEKMTKRYSPLNWAQMMDPLFSLLDNTIDTNLLRLFFDDKNMPREARCFDLMEGNVTRAQFIETLSSPDLLNFEGYEEDQSSLFDRLKSQQKASVAVESEIEKEDAGFNSPLIQEEKEEVSADVNNKSAVEEEMEIHTVDDPPADESDEEDNSLNRIFSVPDEEQTPGLIDEEPDESLNSLFQEKEEDNVAEETNEVEESDMQTSPQESEKISGYNIDAFRKKRESAGKDVEDKDTAGNTGGELQESESSVPFERLDEEDDTGETMMADFENDSKPEESSEGNEDLEEIEEEEDGDDNEEEDENKKNGETPMWMRFVDPEELAEGKTETSVEYEKGADTDTDADADENEDDEADPVNTEEENVDEDGFVDEPIIDLTKDRESSEKKSSREQKKLNDQLASDRELFVSEIFRGSERAYDEAVEDISQFHNWKSASQYIEKNVFKRNLVDMYSEAAVDFTDRLQTYFLKKQNRN